MKFDSILLLSGGLDSAANLAFAYEEKKSVLCLNIHYGQRASDSERKAAKTFADYYEAQWLECDLPFLGGVGGSSLTDPESNVPTIRADMLDHKELTLKTAKSVWVPNRNGLFINVAGVYADRFEAKEILVGFNLEEASTFPDNSTDFMNAATRALAFSTRNGAQVKSYTDPFTKIEIVKRLRDLKRKPFPFESVWSCYHDGEKMCGMCESCQRFKRATSI